MFKTIAIIFIACVTFHATAVNVRPKANHQSEFNLSKISKMMMNESDAIQFLIKNQSLESSNCGDACSYVPSLGVCREDCNNYPNCYAWVYRSEDSGCFFKSSSGCTMYAEDGHDSGFKGSDYVYYNTNLSCGDLC